MGYCATGGMSIADWDEIKKLCASMRKDVDAKLTALEEKLQAEIDNIDANQLKVIKNQLAALAETVAGFMAGQDVQDSRLDDLEAAVANVELSTSEILEIWEARNNG